MPRKKEQGEPGAPAWLVTFSDLMSLLLTFFVLLLSFSTVSENDFNSAMMSMQGALGLMPQNTSFLAPFPTPQRRTSQENAQAARRLRRRIQVLGLEKKVKVEFDAMGGLKINLPDQILFETGTATLSPDALPLLLDIGSILAELPDTFIEIHGHTDGSPLSDTTRFRDNYDLSYFRAYAVTDRFVSAANVPREQFEIVAAGDSQPLATNDTVEGRAANRRVEIYVRGLVNQTQVNQLQEGSILLRESRDGESPVSPAQERDELR